MRFEDLQATESELDRDLTLIPFESDDDEIYFASLDDDEVEVSSTESVYETIDSGVVQVYCNILRSNLK